MPSIDHFNLRSFDLNLLLAFDALMEERSVTRAANRLRIGQPAMSHALSNLRLLLDDDLLIRRGQVMQPTARAQEVAAAVRTLLEDAQAVLLARPPFDPATTERTVHLGLSAETEFLLMPPLIARLRESAPGLRVLVRATNRAEVADRLDDGAIELAVGCFERAGPSHLRRGLYDESHRCCFHPGRIAIDGPIGLDAYRTLPHVLVSLKESLFGCLEDALDRAGVRVAAVAATPHFLSALGMVAQAPLITTLPARVAERWAPVLGLRTSPLPMALAPFSVGLLWHTRSARDPAAAWLRDQVADLLAGPSSNPNETSTQSVPDSGKRAVQRPPPLSTKH